MYTGYTQFIYTKELSGRAGCTVEEQQANLSGAGPAMRTRALASVVLPSFCCVNYCVNGEKTFSMFTTVRCYGTEITHSLPPVRGYIVD